jgi:NAD(P)-dependent dehydrogenase (short-subunit alcohol dehydrogenase family)
MSGPTDLTGQVAVVTGATGGMGRVIALELARRGAHLVTVARDPRRPDPLRRQIETEVGTDRFDVIPVDLSRRDDVIAAAHHIAEQHPAVHILINNAGAHFPDRRLSDDGIEMHIALDYLAGFGLTTLLCDPLTRGRARIVNVASDTVNDTRRLKLLGHARPATLDANQLNDLRALNPVAGFVPFQAYARAKLLTVMAGYEAAKRLAPHGVTVNSVHPGIVATDIINDLIPAPLTPFARLIRRAMLTPEQGASAALRLATDPKLTTTGSYFIRETPASTPAISYDPTARQQLWTTSANYFNSAS